MDNPKTQIIDRINQATNILVTVSANPSVDQLAGAIGLTLMLNKIGKHATAVFSGQTPSTIEFLQPEKTLETNTDSLRDFIIALDKSKADKLRYKVEDQQVRIFITPYRTSITDKDLEFTQGDFNVEVVIALGVDDQSHLDGAITAHGRILHDATIIGINTVDGINLGSINWSLTSVSSLCEMLVDLGLGLKPDALDGQMATAFLTGIVAETNRFSNEKTSSATMQMSAKLMAAGANQQLIATELQVTKPDSQPINTPTEYIVTDIPGPLVEDEVPVVVDGSLQIDHQDLKIQSIENTADNKSENDELSRQIHIDETGQLQTVSDSQTFSPTESSAEESRMILDPPTLGGQLTANTVVEGLDPSTDPLGAVTEQAPLLTHDSLQEPVSLPVLPTNADNLETVPNLQDVFDTTSTANLPDDPTSSGVDLAESPNTLADLEKEVSSPHVDAARDAVAEAMNGVEDHVLAPIQALNAQPMDLNLGEIPAVNTSPASAFDVPTPDTSAQAPPPVPPPMMPPTFPT